MISLERYFQNGGQAGLRDPVKWCMPVLFIVYIIFYKIKSFVSERSTKWKKKRNQYHFDLRLDNLQVPHPRSCIVPRQ